MCVNTGGAVVWGGDLGVVGANGAEARGSSYGFPEMLKAKKAYGRFVEEGGNRQSNSGSGYRTTLDLIGQYGGDSGRMGGRMSYLRCIREGYGIRGRGEDPCDMVETGVSREIDEGHARTYFGISKGAATTGIWNVARAR